MITGAGPLGISHRFHLVSVPSYPVMLTAAGGHQGRSANAHLAAAGWPVNSTDLASLAVNLHRNTVCCLIP